MQHIQFLKHFLCSSSDSCSLRLGAALHYLVHAQVNALLYRKSDGHWLRPHVDDRKLAYDTICTLSLGCDATMEFWKEARGLHQQGPTILHELPRLSLQVI
jgi:hypothetical protein